MGWCKRGYNRAASERLLRLARDFPRNGSSPDSFLMAAERELSKGADPISHFFGGPSVFEMLLETGHNVAMRLLDRIATIFPVSVETLPVLLLPDFYGDNAAQTFSPIDIVCRAKTSFEDKQKKLAWLIEHTKDVATLANPMNWEIPVEEDRSVRCIPPLVRALQAGNVEFFETFLERLEQNCERDVLSAILNLHSMIVTEDGIFSGDDTQYTVLHAAVEAAREASGTMLERHIVSKLIPRLVRDGASPDECDAMGRTPYGLACELEGSFAETPELFRSDEPWREFELRDARGRFLLAAVLDRVEAVLERTTKDNRERSLNVQYAEDMARSVLLAYTKYESQLPKELVEEHRLLFSSVAARLAVRDETSVHVVETLVKSGADPWYAAPGRGPVWREVLASWPLPSEMLDVFLYTPSGENPPLAETMSTEDVEWIRTCGRKGAEQVFRRLQVEREERGVSGTEVCFEIEC